MTAFKSNFLRPKEVATSLHCDVSLLRKARFTNLVNIEHA